MPPIAATMPDDCDHHPGRMLVQERLLHAEAQHRLANLLQFVSSNLVRAARRASEPQARTAIGEAAEQVTSIGRLQRSLDHAPTSPHECAMARLRPICASLETLLLIPSGHALMLDVHASAQDLHVPSDLARRLALIVTELVINAAKHAFPGGARGQVTVELVRKTCQIVCTVRDNGIGALPGRDSRLSQGMVLADTLAIQAGGRCRWLFRRTGTEVEVLLPIPPL